MNKEASFTNRKNLFIQKPARDLTKFTPRNFTPRPCRCLTSQLHFQLLILFWTSINNFLLLNLRFCIFFDLSSRSSAFAHQWELFIHERHNSIDPEKVQKTNSWMDQMKETRDEEGKNVNCSFFAEFSWSRLIENFFFLSEISFCSR